MAIGDFYEHPDGFIELFPLSTRLICYAIEWASDEQYPPGPGQPDFPFPFGFYIDELVPGGGYSEDYPILPEGLANYSDFAGIIDARRNFIPFSGLYIIQMGVIWYNLNGLPTRSFERAELVFIPDGDADEDDDDRALVADWVTTRTPFEDEAFSVTDDYEETAPADSVLNLIDISDIVTYAGSGIPPAEYADEYPAIVGGDERWVVPFDNIGPLASATNLGLRFHVSGGEPTGENTAIVECFFDEYDSEEYGTTLTQRAQHLPHLRLWPGAEPIRDLRRAHATLNINTAGRGELSLLNTTYHIARLERGRQQRRDSRSRRT